MDLKEGDIIEYNNNGERTFKRKWVVIEITESDLEQGVNAPSVGLYAFGGMWYGTDILDYNSYGKILSTVGKDYIIVGNVKDYNLEEIRNMVG